MFERIAASFALARSSWQVLRTDKQLVIFPILSGACCLFVLAAFALPFVAHPQWLGFLDQVGQQGANVPPWVYVVAFAYYFCNYFVIVFFNAALISCALVRFSGETPTLGDGLAAAGRRLPQIVAWAAVSATVGLLLKMLENAHEKLGQIAAAILGTAWTVITYFVVPVVVVEGVGPFTAVRRSLSILRHTWGEALVGGWGIGFFMLLLALPGVALVIAAVVAFPHVLALGIALGVLAAVYFLLLSAVGSALNGIFHGALYQYAVKGEVPGGFDGGTLAHAFRRT
jgi:hypothetical protein